MFRSPGKSDVGNKTGQNFVELNKKKLLPFGMEMPKGGAANDKSNNPNISHRFQSIRPRHQQKFHVKEINWYGQCLPYILRRRQYDRYFPWYNLNLGPGLYEPPATLGSSNDSSAVFSKTPSYSMNGPKHNHKCVVSGEHQVVIQIYLFDRITLDAIVPE